MHQLRFVGVVGLRYRLCSLTRSSWRQPPDKDRRCSRSDVVDEQSYHTGETCARERHRTFRREGSDSPGKVQRGRGNYEGAA